jgi:hypothetical protein
LALVHYLSMWDWGSRMLISCMLVSCVILMRWYYSRSVIKFLFKLWHVILFDNLNTTDVAVANARGYALAQRFWSLTEGVEESGLQNHGCVN